MLFLFWRPLLLLNNDSRLGAQKFLLFLYEGKTTDASLLQRLQNKNLQSFWIKTPRGKYTPDFLILKRKDNKKYQNSTKNIKNAEIEKVLI